eukprot:Trichotokara_eunicae@DN1375_c0_g1_i1.p1
MSPGTELTDTIAMKAANIESVLEEEQDNLREDLKQERQINKFKKIQKAQKETTEIARHEPKGKLSLASESLNKLFHGAGNGLLSHATNFFMVQHYLPFLALLINRKVL